MYAYSGFDVSVVGWSDLPQPGVRTKSKHVPVYYNNTSSNALRLFADDGRLVKGALHTNGGGSPEFANVEEVNLTSNNTRSFPVRTLNIVKSADGKPGRIVATFDQHVISVPLDRCYRQTTCQWANTPYYCYRMFRGAIVKEERSVKIIGKLHHFPRRTEKKNGLKRFFFFFFCINKHISR